MFCVLRPADRTRLHIVKTSVQAKNTAMVVNFAKAEKTNVEKSVRPNTHARPSSWASWSGVWGASWLHGTRLKAREPRSAKFLAKKTLRPAVWGSGWRVYSPPYVDRIWGIWGCFYKIPKAVFYLLKGDYKVS